MPAVPPAHAPIRLTVEQSAGELILAPFQWPVLAYLILSGLACGAALLAASELWRPHPERNRLGRRAAWLALLCAAAGGLLLVADLGRQVDWHRILTEFNPRSAIAWGARILTLFVAFAGYVALTARVAPVGKAPAPRLGLAGLALLGLALGTYPAYVLAQATARPAWTDVTLAPLWLTSAVHGGMALVLLSAAVVPVARDQPGGLPAGDHARLARFDGMLILVSAALLVVWLYGPTSGAGLQARQRVLTDVRLAGWLWIGVVFVGWLLPLFGMTRPDDSRRGLFTRCLLVIAGTVSLRALVFLSGLGRAAFIGA